MPRNISDQQFAWIQEARQLFGLGGAEWSITGKQTDAPGGRIGPSGNTDTNARYMNATIELVEGADREVCYHEVMHVAMYEIDILIEQIMAQLPEDRRDFFMEVFTDAEERFINRIVRNLLANIHKEGSNETG